MVNLREVDNDHKIEYTCRNERINSCIGYKWSFLDKTKREKKTLREIASVFAVVKNLYSHICIFLQG